MQINPSQISEVVEVSAGDTLRVSYDQLFLDTTPISLVSRSVYLAIHDPETDTTVYRTGSIENDVSGSVSYDLTSDDIGTAGNRIVEWKIVDANGLALHVPGAGQYIYWNIYRNLSV